MEWLRYAFIFLLGGLAGAVISTFFRIWIEQSLLKAYHAHVKLQMKLVQEYVLKLRKVIDDLHHGPPISNMARIVGLFSLVHNKCKTNETEMAWTEFECMLKEMRDKLQSADFETQNIEAILDYIREEGTPNPPKKKDL